MTGPRDTAEGDAFVEEVIFEWALVGGLVRLSAIDPDTGVEVLVFGPEHVARSDLERVAVRKLRRRVAKAAARAEPPDKTAPPRRGRGRLV